MRAIQTLTIIAVFTFAFACRNEVSLQGNTGTETDTSDHTEVDVDTIVAQPALAPTETVNTGDTNPDDLVAFAKTLIGTPYRYGSIEPQQGFDCSGFITYVFNRFKIAVPRSSIDFTNVGTEVDVRESRPGDLILFTGTDSTIRHVGHMGIIVENSDSTKFIHSTSGKAYGVTITPLNSYYNGRFVKVIRIFN
jgi:cell wall-associated NlpC family hydrolase